MSDNVQAMIIRADARKNNQLRPVKMQVAATRYAEGSVLISFGHTQVLCNASVEEKVPGFLRGQGQGWVTAEYGMLPRSTHTRTDREAAKGKQSGRTQEIQRLIGRSLRGVVNLKALGERTIHLDCDVLQADGGTRTAAITGAWLALAVAVRGLQNKGLIANTPEANPLLDSVAAISVGIVQGQTRLDLEYTEDSNCETDMNVVMTGKGGLIEVQGTAEGAPFSRDQLNELIDYASVGIAELTRLQQQALAM